VKKKENTTSCVRKVLVGLYSYDLYWLYWKYMSFIYYYWQKWQWIFNTSHNFYTSMFHIQYIFLSVLFIVLKVI